MDNNYFDLKEYCKNPELYDNLANPTTVCAIVLFIKDRNGIISNEAQFVKRIIDYVCEYGENTSYHIIKTLKKLYPNIFNSENNIQAFHRLIKHWY